MKKTLLVMLVVFASSVLFAEDGATLQNYTVKFKEKENGMVKVILTVDTEDDTNVCRGEYDADVFVKERWEQLHMTSVFMYVTWIRCLSGSPKEVLTYFIPEHQIEVKPEKERIADQDIQYPWSL